MGCVCRELPTTKTYPVAGQRRYHWLATPHGESLGTLIICQGRRDAETYGIEEEFTPDRRVRAWLLSRSTGEITADRPGTYRVMATPRGWHCSCTGAVTQRQDGPCKHRAAVENLLAWGDLDAGPGPADATPEGSGRWQDDDPPGEPTAGELGTHEGGR